jgi:hypothetical protein
MRVRRELIRRVQFKFDGPTTFSFWTDEINCELISYCCNYSILFVVSIEFVVELFCGDRPVKNQH